MDQLLTRAKSNLSEMLSLKSTDSSPPVANHELVQPDTKLMPTHEPIPPSTSANLPLKSSQNGNLFIDRNDATLHWYLPDYVLANDIDNQFSFSAKQSGQDEQGNPFNSASLTFTLSKVQPADVTAFTAANAGAKLQEIPLNDMSVVLNSPYLGSDGQEKQRTFTAALKVIDASTLLITIDGSILGTSVIGVYQDLTTFGKASITLSASYLAWSPQGVIFVSNTLLNRPNIRPDIISIVNPAVNLNNRPLSVSSDRVTTSITNTVALSALSRLSPPEVNRAPDNGTGNTAPTLTQTKQTWGKSLGLGLKYQQNGYQLNYTVSTLSSASHVILGVQDLKDFSRIQSEYTELKALGDINQRYPSLSRLYIGVLSRTIVVVPMRYSIKRSMEGCSAVCMALVDSSAGNGSKCKFEFDFTVGPEISPVEFLQLQQEINAKPDLQGYTLKLPEFLHDTPPSQLQTTFQSAVSIIAGSEAHTFAVSVSIRDDNLQTPAVANANLFIMRLCAASGTDLIGSISLKLDDGFVGEIESILDLNFSHTAGSDELVTLIDEAAGQIKLTNSSPLDLQLSRYALLVGNALNIVPGNMAIPSQSSILIPLPSDHTNLVFAADTQLIIPTPMKRADISPYLHIQQADVQETQYAVAINAAAVDFNRVDSLTINMTFDTLTNVVPPVIKLNSNLREDVTHVVIPLANAIFSLQTTVNISVHFVDSTLKDIEFSMNNDYTSNPVLLISQNDIDSSRPVSGS